MIARNIFCLLAAASSASAHLRTAVTASYGSINSEQSTRHLVEDTVSSVGAVSLVTKSQSAQSVQVIVSQVWVGDAPADCGASSSAITTANRVVLVYKDPDTGALSCDRYARLDACFKRTMLLGCDKDTKTADLSIYVSDGEFPATMRIPNPNLPLKCGLGRTTRLGRTLLHTSSFPCATAPDQNQGPVECSSDSMCAETEYCGLRDESTTKLCLPYASADNDLCGGENDIQCNPDTHYCYDPDVCYTSNTVATSGTCQPFGAVCANDAECNALTEYCDAEDSGKCKSRQGEGACCGDDDECIDGTMCRDDVTDNIASKVCTRPCKVNADCSKGNWCGIREFASDGTRESTFCKSYVGVGSQCGGYRMDPDLCDPSVSFCYNGESCMIADLSGECTAFGATCKTSLDCDVSREYCDTNESKCKPKVEENLCCQKDEECSEGFICASNENGIEGVCKRAAAAGNSGPTKCTSNNDCNDASEFCTHNVDLDGLYCKAFEPLGGDCNEFITDLDHRECAPGAFCHQPNTCWGNIEYGSCTLLGGACTVDGDCGIHSYCDRWAGKCKPKQSQGMCCDASDECERGLVCKSGTYGFGVKTCDVSPPTCEFNTDCSAGQYCANSLELNMRICRAYSPLQGACGGNMPEDIQGVCDPSKAYCFNPFCTMFDGGGSCTPIGADCSSHSDCMAEAEYCDADGSGKCRQKVVEWGCCNANEECLGNMECSVDYYSGSSVCALPGTNVVLPGDGGPLPSGPLPGMEGPMEPLPGMEGPMGPLPGMEGPMGPLPGMEGPSTSVCYDDNECPDGQICLTSFPGGSGLCAAM